MFHQTIDISYFPDARENTGQTLGTAHGTIGHKADQAGARLLVHHEGGAGVAGTRARLVLTHHADLARRHLVPALPAKLFRNYLLKARVGGYGCP